MIDPDGRDEYEVDVVNQKITVVDGTQGTPDKFTVIKEDGTKVTSNSYENGTISQFENLVNSEGQVTGSTFSVSNNEARSEVFEFLSENSGYECGWEWQTLNGCSNTGNDVNSIGTNYLPNEVSALNKQLISISREGGTIYESTHSHTKYTSPVPSGYHPSDYGTGDHGIAIELQRRGINIEKQRVYDPNTRSYYGYTIGGYWKER